jgi:hypothetical protein
VPAFEDYAWCLEVWRRAATEEIQLSGVSRSKALALRSRLYRIRAAMEQQRYPYYAKVARAKISLVLIDTGVGGEELWSLVISSRDVRSIG